jgi:hypothetical protein
MGYVKMDFEETGCKGVDENNLALDMDQWYALCAQKRTICFHKMLGTS